MGFPKNQFYLNVPRKFAIISLRRKLGALFYSTFSAFRDLMCKYRDIHKIARKTISLNPRDGGHIHSLLLLIKETINHIWREIMDGFFISPDMREFLEFILIIIIAITLIIIARRPPSKFDPGDGGSEDPPN